jgi:putative aminopeptidase FrvX
MSRQATPSHSALEVCDLRDLEALARLLGAAIPMIGPDFSLIP